MWAGRTPPTRSSHLRFGADRVDREVRAAALLFVGQADADGALDDGVDDAAGREGVGGDDDRAENLNDRRDAAHAAESFEPKDAAGDAAPQAAEAVQGPDAEHVVDLEPLLGDVEAFDEDHAGDAADNERANGVHDVGASAD